MTLSLNLSPELESSLRERAAHSGQPIEVVTAQLLSDAIASETIDDVLAPVRRQVAESGMTEALFRRSHFQPRY